MIEGSSTKLIPILPKRRRSGLQTREEIASLVWTSPWWLGFLVFWLYPMLRGLYYSFTETGWTGAARWVGLSNYVTALTGDPLFWPALGRTLYYVLAVVPLGLAGSLFAASLLNQKLKGENLLRTLYYMPSLMPSVALVVMWGWILNPKYGLLNYLLGLIGILGPGWLQSPRWAMPALILMAVWASFGGAAMLIFLSSLQSIPQELYEVCDLDGANSIQKFYYVTLPMISPAMLFNLLMGIIGAFQSFLYSFLAPTVPGGPDYATYTLSLHIYNIGFEDGRLGYGGAMSWLLFIIIFAIVFANYKVSGRWVFMASTVGSE